ncbi:uncharacterized protein B0I36DRAFT_334743 [Microdochium trichocladiopsis]|uniref:Uncharacterized protein n=1 Tax=Microdochium trichocladiopsis TaxID=1682393 RepID=A0A9P9BIG8_9PEZI|nr:uncharacterized protein B0I36DRAFT_334743 [Microdochium trichocladiopsis]KAH7021565.1 hypothetical protein B0I36DRAFT_334743 [Microdochium trichocladiopsis]
MSRRRGMRGRSVRTKCLDGGARDWSMSPRAEPKIWRQGGPHVVLQYVLYPFPDRACVAEGRACLRGNAIEGEEEK